MRELCPTSGEIYLTFGSRIAVDKELTIPMSDIIKMEKLPTNEVLRVVPVPQAIQLLKEVELRLQKLHAQKRDVTIVGIRAEQLEDIEVVVARKQSRQARLDAADLSEEAEIERDLATVMARKLTPLVDRLNNKKLSTEQLFQFLGEQPDPSRARGMFVALANSTTPITNGQEIVYQGVRTQTGKMVRLAGSAVHRVVGIVSRFDRASRRAEFILSELPTDACIFSVRDVDTRTINVLVHDDASIWLLTQFMAFIEPIALNLIIGASLDARGTTFDAKLVGIPDVEKARQQLQSLFTAHMAQMFPDGVGDSG